MISILVVLGSRVGWSSVHKTRETDTNKKWLKIIKMTVYGIKQPYFSFAVIWHGVNNLIVRVLLPQSRIGWRRFVSRPFLYNPNTILEWQSQSVHAVVRVCSHHIYGLHLKFSYQKTTQMCPLKFSKVPREKHVWEECFLSHVWQLNNWILFLECK